MLPAINRSCLERGPAVGLAVERCASRAFWARTTLVRTRAAALEGVVERCLVRPGREAW